VANNKRQHIKVKYGIVVQAPPAQVAEYIENVDRFPEWQSGLYEIRDKQRVARGKLTPNARVRDSRNILGKTIDATYGVVDFEQGKHMTLEMEQGDDVYWKITFSYDPVDGGTFFTGEGGGGRAAATLASSASRRPRRRRDACGCSRATWGPCGRSSRHRTAADSRCLAWT
jgi:hypothetical protein